MEWDKIILIVSNIAIPIIVVVITGVFTSKKYKKEITLLNITSDNKIREIKSEYEHKLEIQKISHDNEIELMKMQFEHDEEIEKQKAGTNIIESLTDKLSDEIIKQPATQKMINQRTTHNFLQKKSGRGK